MTGGTGILYAPSSKTFVGNTASLSSGTYTIAGEITDGDKNSSIWSFDLIVQPATTIDQTAPTLTIAPQTIDKGATFTYTINENTNISNSEPSEIYIISITEDSGTGITYNSGSKVFSGNTSSLDPGVYAVIGKIADRNNNSSSWTFTLRIEKGDQTAPTLTIAAQSIVKGATFSYNLSESNDITNRDPSENYTITITHHNGTGVTYDSSAKSFGGATSGLESGTYTIVGTISDDNSNESTWAFNLTIVGENIASPPLFSIAAQSLIQGNLFSYTINESNDISHLDSNDTYTLDVLDTGGTEVIYNADSHTFSTDTSTLSGRYTISGRISNSSSVQSNWFFYLTVLDQTAPRLEIPVRRVTVGQDFSFPLQKGDQILDLREGEIYTINITNNGGTNINYDPIGGVLTATTSGLSIGTYTIEGTIVDGHNNESRWSLELLIENPSFLLSRMGLEGKTHTCSTDSNGGVKCWGEGADGKLGTGNTEDSPFPSDVVTSEETDAPSFMGAVHVVTTDFSSCLLTSSGDVKCWGKKIERWGSSDDITYPVDIPESADANTTYLSGVVQLDMGERSICALMSTGGVKCWGSTLEGQLGNGNGGVGGIGNSSDYPEDVVEGDSPTSPPLLSGVIQLSSADQHTCALTSVGGVKCWGQGKHGRLGNGSTNQVRQNYATDVVTREGSDAPLFMGATQVASGSLHTCALTSMGGVKCWGHGAYGQLGNGSIGALSSPQDVLTSPNQPLRNIREIALGKFISCALTSKKQVMCWGSGGNGKLGNNDPDLENMLYPAYIVRGDGDPSPLTGVSQISGGWRHTCGLMDSGVMNCWGHGEGVHLGDGSSVDRNYPSPVLAAASSDPLDMRGSFRRLYTCATAAGSTSCSIDPIQLSLATGTSSPSSNDAPEIIVSGIVAGENLRLYSDESCKTQVGGAATSVSSTVSLSAIPIGVHRFYFRVFDSSDQALKNCSKNFIGYERR